MGAVYRAFDTELQRPVALKILHADCSSRERLLREARAASALNHPNIIAIYEVASEAGVDFIAMEFVEGKSLKRIIRPTGLPLRQALHYAEQIADGLAKAHACGIIHRDLKPANIMVTREGVIKLLDFGLAKRLSITDHESTVTMNGEVAGTPAYMPPEQAQGREADARSDIFSFGAVLYEMITGRRPASEGAGRGGSLEPVGVPAELDRLVSRCLQQDPARRMQHMDDIKLVLLELKEDSESGKFPGSPPQLRRTGRAWRWAAAVLALALAGGKAWWVSQRRPPGSAFAMRRVTFDPGLASQPSISLDGKLVAYASDRSGLSQIYMQQLRGTQAVQLTHNQFENRSPSFAPDGSKVAFRSERDGGGIYLVDALGGPERKIVSEGLIPSFSPDGTTIAYVVVRSPIAGIGQLYLIGAEGGTPRLFQPRFFLTMVGPGYSGPLWSPDSRFLVFEGFPESAPRDEDWWVAPIAGSAPVRLTQPAMGPHSLLRYLEAWRGRYIYYSEGTAVGGMSLYRVPISADPWKVTGPPERLTSAGGMQMGASLSADGHLVFSSMSSSGRLSWVALNANRGLTSGPVQSIASDTAVKLALTTAANGSRLAYLANLFGDRTAEIRIRNLASGREDLIAFSGTTLPRYLRLSPDGSRLAYQDVRDAKAWTFLTDPGATTARAVCQDCRLLSFFSNSAGALIEHAGELARLDLATGTREPLVQAPGLRGIGAGFAHASVSPGDRWIAFTVGRPDGTVGLYLAPVRHDPVLPDAWVPVATERGRLAFPAWSPDGRILYYSSIRDGFSSQAVAAAGRPVGTPWSAYHAHHSDGLKTAFGIQFGITPERLYLLSLDLKGDIWTIDVGPR